jgi:hypothetical protein
MLKKYTRYYVYYNTWALKLANKVFDVNRVINKLKKCGVDFTNMKVNKYNGIDKFSTFSFDTTTPDKVDFYLWYSKHNSKKFGHRYCYFDSMDSKSLPF